MNNALKAIIGQLAGKPKTLFLIDSLGALATALLLFFVVRNFQEYFGMPEKRLYYLSAIAASFCMYSFGCYLFLKRNWSPFLQIISTANLLYCVLTGALLIIHHAQLTALGFIYFSGEIAIICGLAYIELNVAKENKQRLK